MKIKKHKFDSLLGKLLKAKSRAAQEDKDSGQAQP
jgi:hypothetical protein